MICLECQRYFQSKQALNIHIVRCHKISMNEYELKYKITKFCKKCGIRLQRGSLNDYCNKHRDRTGCNNPFYKKHHSAKTLSILKEKCSIATKKLWKDSGYRTKVVNNATGKTRSLEFKENQKINALKQFEDINQRLTRSERMKRSWKDGEIIPMVHSSTESKLEKSFFEDISEICPFKIEKRSVRNKDRTKWFLPDSLIKNYIIIEFYGDFWHANPRFYRESDTIHHKFTAKEIWETDRKRKKELEDSGFFVYEFWEYDYKHDKQKVLNEINQILNWEDLN